MIVKIVYHCTHFLYSTDSKGTCQCQADLLPLRTVHLQSCSGFVTVSGQCVDVIRPLHEEDSIHFKYLYLYGIVLTCS